MSDDTDRFLAEIQALARSGKKIDAIKLYRERTGVDLVTAKDAVETLARGTPPASEPPSDEWIQAEIVPLLTEGMKIQAIKVYRQKTALGLMEAKEAIEAIAQERGIVLPASSGCFGALLLVVITPMAILWLVA